MLNRKRYLPIWVFSASSGIRLVEIYLQLQPFILEVRKRDSNKINNFEYAMEFELLARKVYVKYKKTIDKSNIKNCYAEELKFLLGNTEDSIIDLIRRFL